MREKIRDIREIIDDNPTMPHGEGHYGGSDGFDVVTDSQVIKLRIDNEQSCCEDWGYLMSEEDTEEFVGAFLTGISLTDESLVTRDIQVLEEGHLDEGGVMFVNLETTRGTLQFVAYNAHNGYYGHRAYVESEQLTHDTSL